MPKQRTANIFSSKLVNYFFPLFCVFALSACGGGGSSSANTSGGNTATNQQQTGQFIDAPVDGLSYKASPSGLNGVTKNGGLFDYKAGDTLTFSVAGVQLPPVTVNDNRVTPNSFGASSTDGVGFNVGLFLLSLSTDPSNKSLLTIDPTIKFGASSTLDFTKTTSSFQADLANLASASGQTLQSITPAEVESHFAEQCWINNSCLSIGAASKVIQQTLKPYKGYELVYGSSYITIDSKNNTLYMVAEEYSEDPENIDWNDPNFDYSNLYKQLTTTYQYSLNNSVVGGKKELVNLKNQLISNIIVANDTLYAVREDIGSPDKNDIVAYTIASSNLTESNSVQVGSNDTYLAADKKNNKLYAASIVWGNDYEIKLLRFDIAAGQFSNETQISFSGKPEGNEASIFFHDDYLYLATESYDIKRNLLIIIYQYKIENNIAVLQSQKQLTSSSQNDNTEVYLPYLSITDDGKQLIAAVGGNIYDHAACEASDYEDDEACADRPISWLYSIPVTNSGLGTPLLLQTENLSFDSVAVSGKHIFVGYNFYDEMGIKPSSVGVLQYEIK